MRSTIVCVLVLVLGAPLGAAELNLVKNISSGFDNATGLVIDGGLPDPDYTITPGDLTATVLPEAFPIPPWLANSDTSKWIGFDTPSSNADPIIWDFTTTVSLDGFDPAVTRLVGHWSTDNAGQDILINGASTGATTDGNFGALHSFGIIGGGLFQAGLNTITFRFENAPPGVNPAGLRVEAGVNEFGAPAAFDLSIFNTGVDDNGIPLGDNAIDPHWTLSGSGVTAGVGPDAFVTTGAAGFPVGPWLADLADPTSAWIAPSPDTNGPANPEPGGTAIYQYSTTFTTPMDGTVLIEGLQSADGVLTDLQVDGVSGSFTPTGFNAFADFSLNVEVTGTEHTLSFFVDNGEGGANPTGLRVHVAGAEFIPIPEPSTLVLAAIGLLGLALCLWRKRAVRQPAAEQI